MVQWVSEQSRVDAPIEASIIVNARNEERNIGTCLDAIFKQELDAVCEVVLVDSGSTDKTIDIAMNYPVTVIQIPSEEFTWGRARNAGAAAARGRLLAYLGADALPTDSRWLASLLRGFDSSDIAGVYGRQIARDWAYPMEKFYLHYTYGPHSRVQSWTSGDLTMDVTWFSNVCSALRREVWEAYPFSDTVLFGEDQEWSCRVLLAGYKIVYRADAAVFHSHNYSLGKALRRWFNSGISSYESYMPQSAPQSGFFVRRGAEYIVAELSYMLRRGQILWIPYASIYETAKFIGLILGRYHRRLPRSLVQRLIFKY